MRIVAISRSYMKFELNPYNRNISKEEIVEDIKRVAKALNRDSLTKVEYDKTGNYHSSTIGRKFGTWANALEEAELGVRKYQIIQNDDLIKDLIRVANLLKKDSITREEYNAFGKYSSQTFLKKFQTWFAALNAAGLKKTRNFKVTNEEYFKNIEMIWGKLGRQPNYSEIQKPFSAYCSGAYEKRFGSWRKALEAFINFINTNHETTENSNLIDRKTEYHKASTQQLTTHKTKRNVSWKLRFIIFKRDNFKCQKCGRSPATDPKVILHVDHIKPYSKGGETVPENLETLCMTCNIGKSNME